MVIRLVLAAALFYGSAAAADYPEAHIVSSKIRASVYLPEAESGFYRGLRFDWSGIIGSLEAEGHQFYGPWFSKRDATVRDFVFQDGGIVVGTASGATGPAEEFQTPLGYDTAKPGGTFVKVGVGVLRKADDAAYSSFQSYEVVSTGKWSVKQAADSIEFTQVLDNPTSDYMYVYTKTIRLASDTPGMRIEHRLQNTGRAPIHTKLYDHNFLTLDNAAIGPDLAVILPFLIKPARAADPQFAKIEGNRFAYLKGLADKDRVAGGLQGFGASSSDYDIRVESVKAGAGVRIRGDRPLDNLTLWSIRSVMAVEPFIQIDIEPGKEFSWSYAYDYYSIAAK